MSAQVKTATTPGAFLAADVSILTIFAWACGERTRTTCAWFGRERLSVKPPGAGQKPVILYTLDVLSLAENRHTPLPPRYSSRLGGL